MIVTFRDIPFEHVIQIAARAGGFNLDWQDWTTLYGVPCTPSDSCTYWKTNKVETQECVLYRDLWELHQRCRSLPVHPLHNLIGHLDNGYGEETFIVVAEKVLKHHRWRLDLRKTGGNVCAWRFSVIPTWRGRYFYKAYPSAGQWYNVTDNTNLQVGDRLEAVMPGYMMTPYREIPMPAKLELGKEHTNEVYRSEGFCGNYSIVGFGAAVADYRGNLVIAGKNEGFVLPVDMDVDEPYNYATMVNVKHMKLTHGTASGRIA